MQHSPGDISNPQTTPSGHNSGLLQELTFEQGKGQFLWASDGYHGVFIITFIFIPIVYFQIYSV